MTTDQIGEAPNMVSIRLDGTLRHIHLYASIHQYMPERPKHIHIYALWSGTGHIHLYASFDSILQLQWNRSVITQPPKPRISIPFSAGIPDATRQFCFAPTHPNS